MKKTKLNNGLKLAMSAFFMLSISLANAQQTTSDVAKETDIDYGTTTTGGSIRVIDNKGTIKYLQVKNGLTLLTNTTNDVTTTTWQLGGTLTDDTYIDVDASIFALDGIELVDTGTLAASTDATTESDHGTGTGWTILVRDEATGATKKLLAADLIQSGQTSITATAGQTTYTVAAGLVLPTFSQVWVYRNGAKLIANVDYTVAGGSDVTLVPNGTAPNDWEVYAGDVIEIQYIK